MKNICYKKNIHDNDINNIDEFNLLHDRVSTSKSNKNTNAHYSHIINGCTNTCRSRKQYINPILVR